jgi:hypothetical protein
LSAHAWSVFALFLSLVFWIARRVGSMLQGDSRWRLLCAIVIGAILGMLIFDSVISDMWLIIVGGAWIVLFFGALTAPNVSRGD